MLSCLCCLFNKRNSTSLWMALLLLFFVGFGFLPILLYTSLLLVLFSTVFLYSIVSKQHKAVQQVDEHIVEEEEKDLSFEEEISSSDQRENIELNHEESAAKEAQDLLASSSESGECHDQDHHQLWSSEDSEVMGWSFQQQDADHSNDDEYSDGTISDEDSLIEIALPSGHYVGGHQQQQLLKDNEPTKYCYSNNNYYCSLQHKKSRELSAEALFSQHTLREFLAEFNDNMSEEENLIEIDISMGSIKYSRFEIKA
ncbi:hypothetical protein RIF29_23894 [Crotalaria pallida]|uniref:Transmembrane protein n=1 Tax=Crotalaria pallida TaxID=3830 RepID=A0AAN9EJF9_CROPI